MANPNVLAATTGYAITASYLPTGTSSVVLVPNAAASGKVLRFQFITVANIDGTNFVNATVALYSNGAVAQGSAPSGGTAHAIGSTIAVPANASIIMSDRTTPIELNEGWSIIVTSGTASKMEFSYSYVEVA